MTSKLTTDIAKHLTWRVTRGDISVKRKNAPRWPREANLSARLFAMQDSPVPAGPVMRKIRSESGSGLCIRVITSSKNSSLVPSKQTFEGLLQLHQASHRDLLTACLQLCGAGSA